MRKLALGLCVVFAFPVLAADPISADDFKAAVTTLSSDDFEGRLPGSHGEQLTVDFITAQFKKIGLKPGNSDGSYVQKVPLTGHRTTPSFSIGGVQLKTPEDYVAWSYLRQPEFSVTESPLVFVGYGVIAPEYGWDDYKGVDLKGKTMVVLINDPPIPDPADPTKLDDTMFKGKAMTYYGRWTYKYEMAAKFGAAACLIVHETEPAAYPWSVIANRTNAENFDIRSANSNPGYPPIASWISVERARAIMKADGQDFDALKKAALSKDFRPVQLKQTLSATASNSLREVDSANVVGMIEGSDPKLKDQVVVLTAHWDHFGWDQTLPGTKHDQVFHGASDNATGVAALFQIAKALKAAKTPPARTVLFIATTSEEQELLGAKFYVRNPLFPLKNTVAEINIDRVNTDGRTHDVEVVGSGNTTLEDVLAVAAKAQGRVVKPDSRSDKGYLYRADQVEFARAGVPVLYIKPGQEGLQNPEAYRLKLEAYTAQRYHRPTDVIGPDWDYAAAVEDMNLLYQVVAEVASGRATPKWKDGSEFKAKYDEMMAKP